MTVDPPRVVCGITLTLVPTEEGGREGPLLGGATPDREFKYRPNWGLPGMTPPEQSGAMVFGFSRENIGPGSVTRAVIMQLVPTVAEWQTVTVGTRLPCYEGPRVVGHGLVLWREDIEELTEEHRARWRLWLTGPDGAGPDWLR